MFLNGGEVIDGGVTNTVSWTSTTISWYDTSASTNQANASGTTYNWVAIG